MLSRGAGGSRSRSVAPSIRPSSAHGRREAASNAWTARPTRGATPRGGRFTVMERRSTRKQFRDARVEEPHELAVLAAWRGHAVPPGRGVRPELRVRHVPGFDGVVLGREVEVRGAGNEDRPGPDRAEGPFEVSAVAFVGADVPELPGPELGQQVVGVPREMVVLPVEQQLFEGLETELAVKPFAVERLRIGPARRTPARMRAGPPPAATGSRPPRTCGRRGAPPSPPRGTPGCAATSSPRRRTAGSRPPCRETAPPTGRTGTRPWTIRARGRCASRPAPRSAAGAGRRRCRGG